MKDYKKLKLEFDQFCKSFSIVIPTCEFVFVLGYVWFSAYFDPSMSVVVYINRWGEADLELAMWIMSIPICLYGMFLNIKDLKDKSISRS